MKTRLNKFLASLGVASRRKVDTLMERGQVKVNDRRVKPGYKVDPAKDTVTVGKKMVHKPSKSSQKDTPKVKTEYWAVHKPRGYVSTTNDPLHRPTVTQLVHSSARLYPVGRLDVDSEGLVLLTNDGELTQKLTHPKHHVPKTYLVWVKGGISHRGIQTLRKGVRFKTAKTAPAEVKILEKSDEGMVLEIVLHQGLHRQIRRMMKAVNAEVIRLQRIAIGSLELGALKPKRSRQLSPEEVQALKEGL